MKKIFHIQCLIVFLPALVFAQGKIEAPIWETGDKWEFSNKGTVEVRKMEKDGYSVQFSERTCTMESQGFQTIIFDKNSLQRVYYVKGDKRKKYTMGLKRIFNFPYNLGKQWRDTYGALAVIDAARGNVILDYYDKYRILGWEDITIQVGKFKALKMEAIRGHKAMPQRAISGTEYKHFYWYSPQVKYFLKCEYDPMAVKNYLGVVFNWELTSVRLKK